MFYKQKNATQLLDIRRALNQDNYILYKGKMVSSYLIDIEVHYRDHSEIKSKMMVDVNDDIKLLNLRISELVEKFPKLSGLDGLIVKDLKKKTERGFVPVKSDGLIGDNIQAKDVLSFDLVFSKIWLEVEMDIRTEDKSVNIAFELDVKVDMFISDLKKILIKMGMEYWAEYSKNLNVEFDYYLFSEFTIERNGVDLSNKQEKIDCFLNFESKVECKLEFQSFSKVVCQEYSKYITVSKREFLYKKSYIRRFFNEELDNLIMSEIKQNKNLGYYENILWHWIDEHKEEKPIKIVLNPQSDIRSNSSLTQNKYTRRVHSNMITNEDSPLTVPLRTASRRSTVKSTPKDMFRTSTKIELKYVQYVIVLKSLDYSYLISTSSSCYISNKEFYEKLEQKVFKNLIEKISEYSSRQMEVRDNIDGVCYLNNFPSKVKSKFKKFMKKNLKLSIFGVIILFILVIFIC